MTSLLEHSEAQTNECRVLPKETIRQKHFLNSTKAVTKIRRAKDNFSCTKNGVFFSAASCKKDTIFGTARNFFGPSYFVFYIELMTCFHQYFLVEKQKNKNRFHISPKRLLFSILSIVKIRNKYYIIFVDLSPENS